MTLHMYLHDFKFFFSSDGMDGIDDMEGMDGMDGMDGMNVWMV